MKILSLKLKGFTGIKRGMGLDEISIDFSGLSGLIAFSGQNGRGKTTVMENLQPFRVLPSRYPSNSNGLQTYGRSNLKEQVFLRDSYKDLTFALNGDQFRTLVKIDSDSNRSEGFIWLNGKPQLEGKVSSFDKYLVEVFGSPELFFNSVFSSQGCKKISDLTTGDLKKLFSEFLRLHLLEQHEATSKQAINSIGLICGRIGQDIGAMNGIEGRIAALKNDAYEADLLLMAAVKSRLFAIEAHSKAECGVVEASEAVSKNSIIKTRLEETRKQIEQAKTDHVLAKEEAEIGMQFIQEAHAAKTREIETLKAVLADETKIREAVEKVKQNEIISARVANLRNRIADLHADYDREKGEYETKSGALKGQYRTVHAEIESLKNLLADEALIREAAEIEKAKAKAYNDLLPIIESHQGAIDILTEKIHKAELEHNEKTTSGIQKLDATKADLNEKVRLSQDLNKRIIEIENDSNLVALKALSNQYREKISTLNKTDPDCPGRRGESSCEFIKQAKYAEKEYPKVVTELAEREKKSKADIEEIQSDIKAIEEQILFLRSGIETMQKTLADEMAKRAGEIHDAKISLMFQKKQVQENINAVRAHRQAREKAAELAVRLPEIDRAGGKLVLSETRLAEITAEGLTLKEAWTAREKALNDGMTSVGIEIRAESSKIDPGAAELAARLPEVQHAAAYLETTTARLNEIVFEAIQERTQWETRESNMLHGIDALENLAVAQDCEIDAEADAKLETAKESERRARESIAAAEREIASTEARIATIQRDIEEAEKKLAKKAELEAEKNRMESEVSEWIYLKNACGAGGLRALEIDSVAPTISGWANDLLSGTFGPQYSVKFLTQDPETKKEILDIIAIADDGEVLLENLSGGQKVWILKALRLAMTLVSKEKSGMDFRSSFADEEDGALDSLNAQSFIQMYRSFMGSGGFDDLFFISHRPECVEMADHQILFNGGISIE